MLRNLLHLANAREIEKALDSKCQKDIICIILWWGGEKKRISESLLENDSLCYSSSDFLADSYQEERELAVHQREKKICESDFPLLPPPFPKAWDPPSKNEKDQVAVTVTEQT